MDLTWFMADKWIFLSQRDIIYLEISIGLTMSFESPVILPLFHLISKSLSSFDLLDNLPPDYYMSQMGSTKLNLTFLGYQQNVF